MWVAALTITVLGSMLLGYCLRAQTERDERGDAWVKGYEAAVADHFGES